jgi:hypothetical protein
MARPRKNIDEKALIAMAERGWSIRGIAAAFGVGAETIRVRYGAKIMEARQHGAQKLLDILWQRGVKEKSDRVLVHLADRIIGKVPQRIELSNEELVGLVEAKLNQGTEEET